MVTLALGNIPETRTLFKFGNLSLREQLGIEANSVAYLIVADSLQRAFRRTQPMKRSPIEKVS